MTLSYPYPGCIVEFLEDNSPKVAMVLEDTGGKLRLLLPGRKETRLTANRVLPWIGPVCSGPPGKEEAVRLLEQHQQTREKKAAAIPVLEIWELAQGEVDQAQAAWFAELMENEPDIDTVAAYGRALLGCKTHFRFQPPDFQIHPAEVVEKRLAEQKSREEKEALTARGSVFLRMLWDVACHKRQLPPADDPVFPEPELAERIGKILFARMANPDSLEDEALWRLLSRGLPESQHQAMQLLMAWGLLPAHYNFWLDRADYDRGDDWWREDAELVASLAQSGQNPAELEECDLPFVSVDGPSTIDIDDAFYLEKSDSGWELTIALAAPSLAWPFGSSLDKAVLRRATSIYLPEGDLHMLPVPLGTDAYSLLAGKARPAFCLRISLDQNGECLGLEPFVARVKLAANLRYGDVQQVLSGNAPEDSEAMPYAEKLREAHELALKREALRLGQGAVIMLRQEPEVILEEKGGEVQVKLEPEKPAQDAQRLVSEMMILASAALADWAHAREIPLLHRTQNVAVPPEYAGIWSSPHDMARILRALVPSTFEVEAKPHAALGLSRYAQVTSPLRRYPDFVNEAQIMAYLASGKPRWDAAGLEGLLEVLSPALEAANHAQRNRPRYWKLLYFRQQGDKVWYRGEVTEENEMYATVALPVENIQIRGRRNMFDERTRPGTQVKVRLGKINPLLNDIQILEVIPEE